MTRFHRIVLGFIVLLLLLPATDAAAQGGGEAFLTTAWWRRMDYKEKKDQQVLVPTEQQVQFAWSDQPFAIHIPFDMRLREVDGQQYTPHYVLKYYVSGFGPYEKVRTVEKFQEKWKKKQDAEERARPKTEDELQDERNNNAPPADVEQKKEPPKAHFDLTNSAIGLYRLDGESLVRTKEYPLRWYKVASDWRSTYGVKNIDDSEYLQKRLNEGNWPHTLSSDGVFEPASDGKAAFFLTFDPRNRQSDEVYMWDYVGEKAEGTFHYEIEEKFFDGESDSWKHKVISEGELEITIRQNGFQVSRIETGHRGWWGRVKGTNRADEITEFYEGEPKAAGPAITFESTWRQKRGSENLERARSSFNYKGPVETLSTMRAKIRVPSRMYDHVPPIFMNQQFVTERDSEAGRWNVNYLKWIKIYTYQYDREEIERQLDRMAVLYGKNDPTEPGNDDRGRRSADGEDDDDADDGDDDDSESAGSPDAPFTPIPGQERKEHYERLTKTRKRAHEADMKGAFARPVEIQHYPHPRNIKSGWTWDDQWATMGPLHGGLLDFGYISEKEYKGVLARGWTASHPTPTHRLFRVVYHCYWAPEWADQFADVYVARLSDLVDNRAGGPGPSGGPATASQIDPGIQDWYDEHYELVRDAKNTIAATMATLGRLGQQREKLRARGTKLLELMMTGFRFERDEQGRDLVENAWQWYRDAWQESDRLDTGESAGGGGAHPRNEGRLDPRGDPVCAFSGPGEGSYTCGAPRTGRRSE